jgi:hypothetical protein
MTQKADYYKPLRLFISRKNLQIVRIVAGAQTVKDSGKRSKITVRKSRGHSQSLHCMEFFGKLTYLIHFLTVPISSSFPVLIFIFLVLCLICLTRLRA